MTDYGRWIVFVRGVNGDADTYGVYGSAVAAHRKAEAINKRLPQDADSDAWAYIMPLYGATTPASEILGRAGV